MSLRNSRFLIVFCVLAGKLWSQAPAFLNADKRWADSVFNSLTPDQRTAQLFMIAAYSNLGQKHVREIREQIEKYNIGGLIWMQGGPYRQATLAQYYQTLAKTPLLYSTDGEWGFAMRLDSTPRFPKQMTLGAIRNDSLIYHMGREIGREFRRLGVHVNFAPVADVNNNPRNPVIGMRSFGEDKYNVARKCYMYMAGMQDEHVMANGKHFPGHGDTESDSHATLPFMPQSAERLDSLELYPFKYLFDRGLGSVMVAHLNIPALDTTRNRPSTLSPAVVTWLLKERLHYQGLIFTDALSMQGVAKFFKPGEMEVKAIQAGNDVMLFSASVQKGIAAINKAIADSVITREQVDEKCKRILLAKYWCGLNVTPSIPTRHLDTDINSSAADEINAKLAEAAVTVLRNERKTLPLRQLDTLQVYSLSFGDTLDTDMNRELRNYCYVANQGLRHDAGKVEITNALSGIENADVVVIQVNKSTIKPDKNYGVGDQTIRLIDSIASVKPVILALLVNPYVLNSFPNTDKFRAIVLGYENMPSLQKAVARVIIGESGASGQLPVTTNAFKRGSGIQMSAANQTELTKTKETFQNRKFGAVDSLALYGIREKAYPGCQIVAMKNGEVIYQKSFGHFTYYQDSRPVTDGSIYDLASVTKIAGSSLALMRLMSEGKFDYKRTLGSYLPELNGTNKADLKIEEVLTHQAGLPAFIPFYQRTIYRNGRFKPGYYSFRQSDEFPVQVARNLFVVKGFRDTILNAINSTKIVNPGKYLYSDVGYYYMQRIIESITQQPLDKYLENIYAEMGVGLRYNPLRYFSRIQVVPTENDHFYRKQVLQGYVHDPGAALMGGVAGHAGLFGNALDVAKLMQMYLNKGQINGVRILDSNVVKDFTSCHYCPGNRRGLCFEKPEPDLKKDSPVTSECSLESYGHSGFTGTFTWADPKNGLIIVFLSNRVYPNADDNKLVKLGIRGKIHKAFYDALKQTP